VILVDADLREPELRPTFDLPEAPGLVTLLAGTGDVTAALVPMTAGDAALHVLSTSRAVDGRAELFSSVRAREVFEDAKSRADYLVIDCSPLGEELDALPLAQWADVVLLAVRPGATELDGLRKLGQVLNAHSVRPAGLVVVGVGRHGRPVPEDGAGPEPVEWRADQPGPAAAAAASPPGAS
jgi:receptor protein-tyrosine kinase